MRVLLIAGGWSNEREISLAGAEYIQQALTERDHDVCLFDPLTDFSSLLSVARKYDVAFINLHGAPGEDGLVQAMLERVGCPYQGSGPAASFLALHKAAAKQLFQDSGLLTPKYQLVPQEPTADWTPNLKFPIFVKPNTGGSSLNAGRADTLEELHALLRPIFAHGNEALLEEAIDGTEITCGVIEQLSPHGIEVQALPPVLIRPPQGTFFDYHSKYSSADEGGATEICPAPLSPALLRNVKNDAMKAHAILGLAGYSRSDFMLRSDGTLYLLETNTLPGMTTNSLVPKEAAAIGMSFGQLLEHLLIMGIAKSSGHAR